MAKSLRFSRIYGHSVNRQWLQNRNAAETIGYRRFFHIVKYEPIDGELKTAPTFRLTPFQNNCADAYSALAAPSPGAGAADSAPPSVTDSSASGLENKASASIAACWAAVWASAASIASRSFLAL